MAGMTSMGGSTSMTSMTSMGGLTSMTSMGGSTSMTSMGGMAGPGSFGGLTAALMVAREGIVGRPQKPQMPPQFEPGSDARMATWSCPVRKLIATGELLAGLAVHDHAGGLPEDIGAAASLYSVVREGPEGLDGTPRATFHKLCDIVRPHDDDFLRQVDIVMRYADLRVDRVAEIVTQINMPLAFFGLIARLDEERTSETLHLLDVVHETATRVVMLVKHAVASVRPDALSPQLQPVIPTPGHSALPSGHATQAFAIALVLAELIGAEETVRDLLLRQAHRIAVNRTVAGLHFPVDSIAGMVLGRAIARYVVARATGGGRVPSQRFDGRGIGDADFSLADHFARDPRAPDPPSAFVARLNGERGALDAEVDGVAPGLAWMWRKARDEHVSDADRGKHVGEGGTPPDKKVPDAHRGEHAGEGGTPREEPVE